MSSPKMPWFPFYGRDFFNDEFVKTLTLRGVGIYLYLLYHQWEHGSIPDIPECKQFPIIKSDAFDDFQFNNSSDYAKQETTLDALTRIHNERFDECGQIKDRFINKRLEEIRVQHLQRDQANRERSRKGGLARSMLQASSKHSSSTAQASHTESDTESEEEKKKKDILVRLPATATLTDAEAVLEFLNLKTGKRYRGREANGKPTVNLEQILNRLQAGATVEQCRAVIAIKCRDWKDRDDMKKFLRPATLFNRTKFEQYLGEVGSCNAQTVSRNASMTPATPADGSNPSQP